MRKAEGKMPVYLLIQMPLFSKRKRHEAEANLDTLIMETDRGSSPMESSSQERRSFATIVERRVTSKESAKNGKEIESKKMATGKQIRMIVQL